MAYAAWSKGTAALLLAIRDVARTLRRRGRARRGVAPVAAGARRARSPRAERSAATQGLALGRRDGGDRRHVRGRRAARRVPPRRGRGLPHVIAPATSRSASAKRGLRPRRRRRCARRLPARHRAERRRQDDAAARARRARRADDGRARAAAARRTIGYLGHEPLVYRELTPLENLTSSAGSTACPSAASGSGCCSSASASGRCATSASRRSRAACSSGSRSAGCSCTTRRCLLLDEPFNALDAAGAELLDGTLEEPSERAVVVATHDPGRVEHLATERLAFA